MDKNKNCDINKLNKDSNHSSVAKSYAERRRPLESKIPPHVRYNPDTLNEKELD